MKKIISFILCLTIICSAVAYIVSAENTLNENTTQASNTFSVTEINMETGEETVRTFDKIASPQLDEPKSFELPVSKTMSSRAIIGDDERIKVEDTTIYPYSAIVLLEIHWSLTDVRRATGFMISENVVATAAHALYKKTYGGAPTTIKVYPAKDGLSSPYDYAYAKSIGVCTQFVEFIDNSTPINGEEATFMEEDWGAVILDEPLGNETGTIELKCPTNSELYNLKSLDSVRICGYSTPYELLKIYYQYETIGNIASYSNDMINYSLDTQSGQSGAPILNKDNKAIGIHFGFDNYDSLNKAVRMDANMLYYYNLAIENHKES